MAFGTALGGWLDASLQIGETAIKMFCVKLLQKSEGKCGAVQSLPVEFSISQVNSSFAHTLQVHSRRRDPVHFSTPDEVSLMTDGSSFQK